MTSTLSDLLATKTDLLWVTLVSAVVSAGVSYLFKRSETRHTADVSYEYEQRKELRKLIGRYHGRLLNAANSMNYRLWNFYANQEQGWLYVGGKYGNPDNYYFRSFVYRFLNIFALIRQLETEAVLLDARIAEKKDFVFLNYAAALHWVMTDVALTKGMPYDDFHQTDHFFSDHFRQYCDCCLQKGSFIGIDEFSELLRNNCTAIEPVLEYFDGLSRKEARLRWDRLVAFHLLIMAFINSFGYKRQYSPQRLFIDAAKQMKDLRVLKNLVIWLPKHDLGQDREAKRIVGALENLLGRSTAYYIKAMFGRATTVD